MATARTATPAQLIRVIEQTHSWGDCLSQGERRDHCHCALEVRALSTGTTHTCGRCAA